MNERNVFMSNRLFQTVIHQMKDIVGRTIGAIDENGIIIACSELRKKLEALSAPVSIRFVRNAGYLLEVTV